MQSNLECIYKGIQHCNAGSFKRGDELINYAEFYKIFFDQNINGIQKECSLKISKELALNSTPLLKPYDRIVIKLDVIIRDSRHVTITANSIEKK